MTLLVTFAVHTRMLVELQVVAGQETECSIGWIAADHAILAGSPATPTTSVKAAGFTRGETVCVPIISFGWSILPRTAMD
jgi:hypothetical protein